MWTQLLALPWYTWLALVLVGLLSVGVLSACGKLLGAAITALVQAAWVGGRQALWAWAGWAWVQPSTCGTAYWAWKRNLVEAGLLREAGIPLGTWKGRTLYEAIGGGHVALFGPPRSGKSTGCIMPTLRQYPGSVVVNDLRGELYQRTHAAREAKGLVYRYAPEDEQSCCLNVLDAVAWRTDEEFADLHRIVDHLIPHAADEDPTFRVHAVPLLLAICLYCHRAGQGHLPGVLAWMDAPDRTLDEKLAALERCPHPHVQAGASGMLSLSEGMRRVAWGIAQSALVIFRNPRVARHSTSSDVLFEDLLYGAAPVTLYLCFKLKNMQHMGPLFGAVVDSLVAILGDPPRPPLHPLLVCLDECANLGRLPHLEQAVSYLQGSGTQVLMAFQNLAQVHKVYGEQTPLLASLSCQVHYRPNDVTTAKHITAHLGQATVMASALSTGAASVVSEYQQGRPLLFPDEVLRLPTTTALVLVSGCPPIAATKLGVEASPQASVVDVYARVRAQLHRRPWAYATLAACALLAILLWPVRSVYTAGQRPAAFPADVATSAVPGWYLSVDEGPGRSYTLTSPFATLAQCQALAEGVGKERAQATHSALTKQAAGWAWSTGKVVCEEKG